MLALRSRLLVIVASLSLSAVLGCDGGSPPSVDTGSTEATVTGTVKVGGVAVTGGDITFDPANHLRKDVSAKTAKIDQDGKYTITTLTGTNTVKLGGALTKKNRALQNENRVCEVKSGENTFDFDATSN